MVNEHLQGIHLLASVEAISLGVQFRIHPWILYDIISNAAGNSWLVAARLVFYSSLPDVSFLTFKIQSRNTNTEGRNNIDTPNSGSWFNG